MHDCPKGNDIDHVWKEDTDNEGSNIKIQSYNGETVSQEFLIAKYHEETSGEETSGEDDSDEGHSSTPGGLEFWHHYYIRIKSLDVSKFSLQ